MGWFSTLFGMPKDQPGREECGGDLSELREAQERSRPDRQLLHVARQILAELDGIHETLLNASENESVHGITKQDLVNLENRLMSKLANMLSDRSMLAKLASGLEKSTDTLEKTVAANQPAGDPGARAGS